MLSGMKKKIIYGLAFFHLLLISLSVFHGIDRLMNIRFLAEPLAFISTMNYSVWRYGFFSPDVGKSVEIEINMYKDSIVTQYSTLQGFDFFVNNWESANRFYGFKHHTANDTTFMDLCSRSAATRMLNLIPDCWRVDYTTRSIRYPTMKGFLEKDTIVVHNLYTTSYELF